MLSFVMESYRRCASDVGRCCGWKERKKERERMGGL